MRTGALSLKRNTPPDSEEESPIAKRSKLGGELEDLTPLLEDVRLEDIPRLCVERASPLVCVNQDIVGVQLGERIEC